ncbi:MAG: type II secretion system ATPase GspE [Planctomycetota bacterium]|nr:type II secretion system ATPase GspE [Planctomycetota bacterium]
MEEALLQEFLKEGVISEKQLAQARQEAHIKGEPVIRVLREEGALPEDAYLEKMSSILKIPYDRTLANVQVPERFVDLVPLQFARMQNIIGIEERGNVMRVATCEPLAPEIIDEVEGMLRMEVEILLAPRAEIADLINHSYVRARSVDHMLEDLKEEDIIAMVEKLDESEDVLNIAYKAPIVKLVNMLFFEALRMRASDIHLQPYEDKLQVRYRIDGILHDTQVIPKKVQDAVISRIKIMGKMDIAERRLPQDGRTTVKVSDTEVDVRISSVPTSYGERIVLRLLDKSARLYELHELGLDERNLHLVDRLIHMSHGIIFVTGPTGSGKTTTLYAMLQRINSLEKNILTIEDPIEYNIRHISQIQVSPKKGLTFATGLRSLLRQDPNIMMVGEVRDVETARIAVQSALTGHLVFSTLHTNDAPGAITRMLDIGVEPYLVSSSLIGVMAQRLVRMICPRCKVEHRYTDEQLAEIGIDPKTVGTKPLFRGKGCSHCLGTGYWDRTAIFEVLIVDDDIRDMVLRRSSSNEIKQVAVSKGMRTLRMDGARKVLEGLSTPEEVMRVTQLDIF